MKKIVLGLVVLMVVALIGAGAAMAGSITSTKHNLSSTGTGSWTSNTTEICVFCHTPHGANIAQGPLWNRSALTTNFTMYSIQASTSVTNAANMSGSSKACMSCHDGVTALNALANGPGNPDATVAMTGGNTVTGISNIGASGGTLSNDHPIAVAYDVNKASLRALTAGTSVAKVNSATANIVNGAAGSTVQCESCHEPHTTTATFLRWTNASSQLCLTCHVK